MWALARLQWGEIPAYAGMTVGLTWRGVCATLAPAHWREEAQR